MPRNITPSDIDLVLDGNGNSHSNITVFDNAGKVLLAEFSTRTACWADLPYGQRFTYRSLLVAGKGDIRAVCCRHAIPAPGVEIDTVKDILAFQAMNYRDGEIGYSKVYPGRYWVTYVKAHFGIKPRKEKVSS